MRLDKEKHPKPYLKWEDGVLKQLWSNKTFEWWEPTSIFVKDKVCD